MKKVINFSKGFIPCAIISALIIVFGIVGFITKGINFGIDFKPGLIEEVKIAPVSATVTYTGSSKVTLDFSKDSCDVVISGTSNNKTEKLSYADNKTVSDLVASLNKIAGVTAELKANGDSASSSVFINSAVSTQLSSTPFCIYSKNEGVDIDSFRSALEGVEGCSVKQLGNGDNSSFQVRMAAKSDDDSSTALQDTIIRKLGEKYGNEKIVVVKTDFIGSSFSKSLASKSVLLLLGTVLLIWAYAAVRFHWDFAVGSVIALIHDSLIMLTFIVWTQMEFSTTVLAAVLTIVGYSINATVVILDRMRYNMKAIKVSKFTELANASLTDTLGRSIITTVTTLFAVVSLYVFTTGSIKDFALALMVGLISGCYSSIFISSGFISAIRKNWKQEYGIYLSEKALKKGVLEMDSGITV